MLLSSLLLEVLEPGAGSRHPPVEFVHVAIDHLGESVALVAKMAPPFDAQPGDTVGLQIIGTTHLFGGEWARIASSRATLE